MYDLFFRKFNEKIPLTEEDKELIKSYLTVKKLRKKQYILQEGEVCSSIIFVNKGVLRAYTTTDDGSEHIVQFALEGWLIADLYSFLTQEPGTYNIDAIEDSELILISYESHEKLLQESVKYQSYILQQITGAYIALQRRLTSMISLPIEERYTNLIAMYPNIAQRVPQHMLASYMGLTPETLSRVRRRISDK